MLNTYNHVGHFERKETEHLVIKRKRRNRGEK